MSILDYYANHKGLAKISESEDYFITYCVSWTLIVLFMLPLLLYFNECNNILCPVSPVFEHFHHIRTYTVYIFHLFLAFYHILKGLRQLHFIDNEIQWPAVEQVLKEVAPPRDEFIQHIKEQLTISFHKEVSPPSDDFIRQVKEQLTISFHTYGAYLHQEVLQQPEQESCESYAFKVELPTSCQSDILSASFPTSLVVNSNHAVSDLIKREERCSKFINQDLNFLQSSKIPAVSRNVLPDDNSSVQVNQSQTQAVSSIAKPPIHTPENQNPAPPTQIVEPVLGFMPANI